MPKTPSVLTEKPEPPFDPLSDLLASMRLTGTVMFRAEFCEPWSVTTPEGHQLSKVLAVRADRVIPFHVVSRGSCALTVPQREPVWLREGDAVLLPYGDGHLLSGRAPAEPVPVSRLLPPPPWQDFLVVKHGGQGETTSIICGFVQCDELLFHPILRHLPLLLHVSPDASPADRWLATTIRHTAQEATEPSPGSRNMLPRLTELLFVEILRKHMRGLTDDEVGWFAAFNDEIAGAALQCLHTAPFDAWSIEKLASRVGVSRTVLADRFKHFLDQPPMQYLTHWRLQFAAKELKAGQRPLKAIAEEAGYESEAAFSRAFKRYFGLPPGEWRARQRRSLPHSAHS